MLIIEIAAFLNGLTDTSLITEEMKTTSISKGYEFGAIKEKPFLFKDGAVVDPFNMIVKSCFIRAKDFIDDPDEEKLKSTFIDGGDSKIHAHRFIKTRHVGCLRGSILKEEDFDCEFC